MTNPVEQRGTSTSPRPLRGVRRVVLALVALAAVVALGLELDRHLRAAGALARFGEQLAQVHFIAEVLGAAG